MISLDQVMRLEEKVESAVKKIQQLQEENAALRTKCDELTNALSLKSEQLSNFTSDQNQIEIGIKNALERLDSIENTVLKNGEHPVAQAASATTMNFNAMQEVQKEEKTVEVPENQEDTTSDVSDSTENEEKNQKEYQEQVALQNSFNASETSIQEQTSSSSIVTYNTPITNEDTDDNQPLDSIQEEYEEDSAEEDQDGLGFDIF
ncbi:MAG: cell division protein ZapB [Spirochaetales bacterium]|nr:cell division protein ZapB [Spirochaetales bacterium]